MATPVPKNPKKTPKTINISLKIGIAAKTAYLNGDSLSEICRRYPQFTRDQFRWLKDSENWDAQRYEFQKELERSVNLDLAFSKRLLKESVRELIQQACIRIRQQKIVINSVRDIEKLCEISGLLSPDKKREEYRQLNPEEFDNLLNYVCKHDGTPLPPPEIE